MSLTELRPRPLVLEQLLEDVLIYGTCLYQITDTPSEFSIKRGVVVYG